MVSERQPKGAARTGLAADTPKGSCTWPGDSEHVVDACHQEWFYRVVRRDGRHYSRCWGSHRGARYEVHSGTMKSKSILAMVLLAVALPLAARDYSAEIEKDVARLLNGNQGYKQVTFRVEDEIVTLAGKVPLWSNRTDLEWSVRRLKHVRSVRNELVLDPPAVPDEVLRGRMKRALTERGFAHVKFQAHEGRVVLTGATRTRSQWTRIQDVAWSVEGVREVVNRIRVMEE